MAEPRNPVRQADRDRKGEMFFEYALRMTRRCVRLVDVASAVMMMLATAIVLLLAIIISDHLAPGGLSLWTRWSLRWAARSPKSMP